MPSKTPHKPSRKTPDKPTREAPLETPQKKPDKLSRKEKAYRAKRISYFMGTTELKGIKQLDDWRNVVDQVKELLKELPDTINGFPTRMCFVNSFLASAMINNYERQLDNLKKLYKLVFGTRPRMDLKTVRSWVEKSEDEILKALLKERGISTHK